MTAAGALGLLLVFVPGETPREATDEILRVVPPNCAACLVVEDLAGHVKRWPDSKLGKKLLSPKIAGVFAGGGAIFRFAQFEAAFQSVTGVGVTQMRDDVLGLSVVLAYYAGANPGEDAGAFFCRAANEETLDVLLKGLNTGGDGDKATRLEHAGVEYWRRPNGQGRHHFWLKLGRTGVWTDKEAAIQTIIETAAAKAGVGGRPVFAAMRAATPPGSFLQLLVDPRGLDARLGPPKGNPLELAINRRMQSVWKSLQWSAWTISLEPEPEMSWFWALDRTRLPRDLQEPPRRQDSLIPPSSNVPEVIAAIATTLDVESLRSVAAGILHDAGDPPEFAAIESVARQFLMGLDPANSVLPAVGNTQGAAQRS